MSFNAVGVVGKIGRNRSGYHESLVVATTYTHLKCPKQNGPVMPGILSHPIIVLPYLLKQLILN